jgi:HK97 family phage major capsid protein
VDPIIDRTDAGALIPETVAAEILQEVAGYSSVMTLATRGPDMSSKTHRMPVLSALPSAYWVDGDTGRIPSTNAEWVNKYLTAEKMAAIVPIPTDVLEDSSYDLFGQVRPLISAAIGRKFDRTILHGEDAPASFPDDLVTGATAASHTVDLSTAESTGDIYDALLGVGGVWSKVEEDGYAVNGAIAALTMKGKLRGLRAKVWNGSSLVAAGEPLFHRSPDRRDLQASSVWELDGEPLHLPENDVMDTTKATLIAGNWKKLVYAIRKDLTYKVITEGVIQDEAGNIIYNLATQDMVALRVTFRVGVALPNPPTLANPDSATRYPFAALIP